METDGDVLPMSNAFKLLCEDTAPKSNKKLIEKQRQIAQKIKNVLETSKNGPKIQYKNLDFWTEFDVKHPLHHLQKAVDATSSSIPEFQWTPPKSIVITEKGQQIFIEIPPKALGNRDFLNLTYAAKRGHFACHVARLLSGKFEKVEFTAGGAHRDDPIFADILVDGVRIGFYCPELAKTKRFAPNIGNLRPATIFEDLFKETEIATPKFNQRMLWSILELEIAQEMEKELKAQKTARLAIFLLGNFFENRHLQHAITPIILTARVVRLVKNGKITENQEILTVLRVIFEDFITWSADDVEFVDSVEDDVDVEEYSQLFDVNLVWKNLNLASNLTKNYMERMKKELTICYPLLGQVYAFDPIFIEKLPVFAHYDHVARLHINISQLAEHLVEFGIDSIDNRDVIHKFVLSFEHKIEQTMSERYDFVGIHDISSNAEKSTWSLSEYPEKYRQKTYLIGFRSTSGWKNPLTVGPPAQTNDAKEFRELWKETSELRKFADTRICECVVWSEKPSEKVPRAVLQFVLQKMFSLPATCFSWRALTSSSTSAEADQQHEKKSQEAVFKAYTDLSTVLRGLKGLPLMITNVHGISGYLRGSEPAYPSVFAATSSTNKSSEDQHYVLPEIGKIPLFTPTVTVHIKLEYSGKWGNDVEAIRRLTSSFYVKIAERLREQHKLTAVPTIDQLFILKSGIVFKIVVVNDRILTILEEDVQKLKDSGASRIESSIQGMRLSMWKKKFISEPLLQLSLQSFSTSHKFFGSTVQLFKKWLGSKFLSGHHLNDHIIELLVVAAIGKKGQVPPQSTWSSFCRLLSLISTHPWSARPLIVDFGTKGFSEDERSKLEEKFIKMRPILPPMVVIYEEDHLGSKFTRENPQGIVLNRLVAVAREALKMMEKQAFGEKSIEMETSLLTENLSPYDAIINLEPCAVVRKKALMERKPPAETSKFRQKIPVVELDPVDELVYQLNNSFQQVAMFFYNKYGGHHIGVMFKPQEDEVPAKISRCSLHKSVSDSTLRLNRDEILENIQILGQGIVSDVQLKKQ
ncbi:Nucleolar protein 6 [Caenorhabditis elegans]|uniref:Nucleolar protein 6 n=1 Tax=Caenorhabditis elegans TaxID=6239 RepID=Q95XY4_CAEEL|nr:Nucleolar protein 6 [Caenorhabditis elegans]CCD71797.2 Nucleolar protein 6 [Caenorhabditis elegans]